MRRALTDGVAQCIKQNLPNHKEEHTEANVTQRPAILQRIHHKQDLHYHIHGQKDRVEDIQDNEQSHGIHWAQTRPAFEREQTHCAGDDEHAEGAEAQEPDREGCSVLVELEADEAVDHEANAERGGETILRRGEVGKCAGAWRDDAGVKDEGKDCEDHVEVEECCYFFASCIILLVALPAVCWADGMRRADEPTAVNLLRTCIIMITVIMSAIMCTKSTAPWNMIVLASSMLRE